LIYLQLVEREKKQIVLAVPKTKDISLIIDLFSRHFFSPYKASKGASRLPVLAFYAVYSLLLDELERFKGKALKPLEEHSAADAQTGAVGDIEVIDTALNQVYEAVEIKHNIALSNKIIQDVQQKIMDKSVERYYILTTHAHCIPDAALNKKLEDIKKL
jgi:DNA (cytosine-5)-methyltransferase 1